MYIPSSKDVKLLQQYTTKTVYICQCPKGILFNIVT